MTTDPTPETTMTTTTEPTTTDAPEAPHPPIPPEAQLPVVRTPEQTDAAMAAWGDPDATPERVEQLPVENRWRMMEAMAARLARSTLVPAHIRNGPDPEGNLLVILLSAHDLGISATIAMQKIFVIDGKPGMSAELMRILIRRDGHDIWSETERNEQGAVTAVTWFGIRKDFPERVHSATFTTADATLAGLLGKDVWKKYPEAMLSARATSKLGRNTFEDCLAGVTYTPEELDLIESLDDPPESADAEDERALREEIDALAPEIQAVVAERWKAASLGSVKVDRKYRGLHASEVNAAWLLLHEAKDAAPVDAEIVGEGESHPVDNSGEASGGPLTPDTTPAADSPPPETCEDRKYRCCDLMPQPAAPSDEEYAAWYEAHVTNYREAAVAQPIGPYAGQAAQVDLPADGPLTDADPTWVGASDGGYLTSSRIPTTKAEPTDPVLIGESGTGKFAGDVRGLALPAEGSGTVPVKTDVQIRQEVADMSLMDVATGLRERNLSEVGAPKALRKRLADYICNEEPW